MAESIRDQRHYRPASVDDIEREFPGWHAWRGVNTRYYARLPKTSPPVVVCGAEDLAEVRELILERLSRQKSVGVTAALPPLAGQLKRPRAARKRRDSGA